MPKRISLKGKGADIFFGEYSPTGDGQPAPSLATDAEPTADEQTLPPPTAAASPSPLKRQTSRRHDRRPAQVVDQLAGQSVSQPTNRPVNRQMDELGGQVVDRPKAFYITRRLDRRLDDAVRYFQQDHGLRKVDRSVLLNALLDRDNLWTDEALDELVERLVGQLTSRLTGRPTQ